MLVDPGAAGIQRQAGALQRLGEFLLGLALGFAQRHLHAAVSVDFAFARGFHGQIDHVLEVGDHRRLRAIDCVDGMHPNGFKESTMCARSLFE